MLLLLLEVASYVCVKPDPSLIWISDIDREDSRRRCAAALVPAAVLPARG